MNLATHLFPSERQKLFERFEDRLETARHLNRKTVSFQANKTEPVYRWFKYKEGFSSALVKHFIAEYGLANSGKALDPFAGAGTSLFAAKELGWSAQGIELLPVGSFVIEARKAFDNANYAELETAVGNALAKLGDYSIEPAPFHHITITKDAFPEKSETSLGRYLGYCSKVENKYIRTILRFAAFSILEEISFTRKDGQYLRWDHRSKRTLSGKPFDKGKVPSFEEAITRKLNDILEDTVPSYSLFPTQETNSGEISLDTGSCLEILPTYPSDEFDFVITSPPYCNRYDYTRTYALELAFLGYDDLAVRQLRQQMLSCTVENKDKVLQLEQLYTNGNAVKFGTIVSAYERSEAMSEVNIILEKLKDLDKLNNKNIARMVRNYFLEMCFVIYELARVTKPGGYCVMVNDNVRYGGEEIPADLILSEFAQSFGYSIEKIFVLPRGKGNSSQQMGNFGRTEVRKCVYLWRKR
jgi:DNA modification methylase